MNLTALKTKLIVTSGTSIGEVLFDWSEYLNEQRTKTYPVVLWSLSGARFSEDYRSSNISKVEKMTVNVFVISSFDAQTENKLTVWDNLESKFRNYLNMIHDDSKLKINIDKITGEYVGEGVLSIDSEIGIMYRDVVIEASCLTKLPVSVVLTAANEIIIRYDINVDPTIGLAESDFVLWFSGGTVNVTSIWIAVDLDGSSKTILFTLSRVIAAGETGRITYTPGTPRITFLGTTIEGGTFYRAFTK